MSTTDGWRRPRRVPTARTQGPRTPIDPAKIGRSSVRRRARGMTHHEAFQALADAEMEAHLDRRYEEAADHSHRRAAELAEWRRIAEFLVRVGGPYDLDDDAAVQEELAAEAAAAAAREAEQREAARIADRADQLKALRNRGLLEETDPREGDEAARAELTRWADLYIQQDVDTWLAAALATHRGHYADPTSREAAALLPAPVLAQAALLSELTRLVPAPTSASCASRPTSPPRPPQPSPTSPPSSPVSPALRRAGDEARPSSRRARVRWYVGLGANDRPEPCLRPDSQANVTLPHRYCHADCG
ncbi:hypothetical protein ACFWIB_42365 [Streptomyces sp. NPDC127051]|uniref:hypothetical protein n=1 Tax=Streptomyces sp. NPDC127051 TaxID=3347119 RepID=UPI00364F7E92